MIRHSNRWNHSPQASESLWLATAFLNRQEPIIRWLFVCCPTDLILVHMQFSIFSPLCSCQDEFFDCVETNEDLKRLRSAADSEPEKASLPELKKRMRLSPCGMKLYFHALPIGGSAGHFSCFHSINSCSGQGKFGAFQAFKLSSCDPFSLFSAMSFGRNLKEVCLPQSVPTA